MSISYRTKQTLRRGFSLAGTIVAATAVVLICLLLWLQRFVVYTDMGARLDFDRSLSARPQLPEPIELPAVSLTYADGDYQQQLQQLRGYYITEAALQAIDSEEALQDMLKKLHQLPAGTPVYLTLKNYRGYFFYSSAVSNHISVLYKTELMDALLRELRQSDLYLIAAVPAFWDYAAVVDVPSRGLKTASGSLYADSGAHSTGHWLDPSSDSVQSYLAAVINELKNKGFDEVVLTHFCFPDSDTVVFDGDRQAALKQCADALLSACADETFTLSFASDDPAFSLPEGRCRLYLTNVAPENAQAAQALAAVEDKRRYLVFLATETDSRYDLENGVLWPLN